MDDQKYIIKVDEFDPDCLTLKGKEIWPEDGYASDDKSIAEIIINAANYSASRKNMYHYTAMDRVLWYEPSHPNPPGD